MAKHYRHIEKLHRKLEELRSKSDKIPENSEEIRKKVAIIFDLLDEKIINNNEANQLLEKHQEDMRSHGLENELAQILEGQIRYALRLSAYEGILVWEEIFKLCSLCSEIYILRKIGLPFNDEVDSALSLALNKRYKDDGIFRQEVHKSELLSSSSWAVK